MLGKEAVKALAKIIPKKGECDIFELTMTEDRVATVTLTEEPWDRFMRKVEISLRTELPGEKDVFLVEEAGLHYNAHCTKASIWHYRSGILTTTEDGAIKCDWNQRFVPGRQKNMHSTNAEKAAENLVTSIAQARECERER